MVTHPRSEQPDFKGSIMNTDIYTPKTLRASRFPHDVAFAASWVLIVASVTLPAYGGDNIVQNTQHFEMTAHIAPTLRWTKRINGLCGQKCRNGPRQMYTASFEDTLLMSWMAVDDADPWKQFGNVATFQVSATGEFTKMGDVSFAEKCKAIYGMTTNGDGSIIAVLCEGYAEDGLLPGAVDLLETVRTPDCKEDWEGRCYPIGHYSEIDSPLYLFEYTAGRVTDTPDKILRINHAIGGWRYGHHELLLNAEEDTYFVHLKVTAGPSETNRHEGLTHFAVKRGSPEYSYVKVTDGWGCGPGHVSANRMAYNRANDTWAELCTLDWCEAPKQYSNWACEGITWFTVPGVTRQPPLVTYAGTQLLGLDHPAKSWVLSGGGAAILSLGDDGWLALAAGPGYPAADPKPETIGFIRLPPTVPELLETGITEQVPIFVEKDGNVYSSEAFTRHQWDWLFLPDPDPSREEFKRAGMANLAYFSTNGENSERLLLGWSPSVETQGITSEYVVSEVDREGRLRGEPLTLTSAGWGEDNLFVTMPNSGCVVFPFTWIGDGPGASYPHENAESNATDYPTAMHMTSLCPGTTEQPPLATTETPVPDDERWPTPEGYYPEGDGGCGCLVASSPSRPDVLTLLGVLFSI